MERKARLQKVSEAAGREAAKSSGSASNSGATGRRSKGGEEGTKRGRQSSSSDYSSALLNFNLGFDFDFEFDKQDEMSTLKQKVKTEEEINKCYVNEELTLLQKALYIMRKGYEVQKKSVVSTLDQYICSDYAANEELLPLILNSIDVWDTEFQCLFAQSLGSTARKSSPDKPTISPQNLQKSIELSLEFIDNLDNDEVYESFMNIFGHLVYQLNFIGLQEGHQSGAPLGSGRNQSKRRQNDEECDQESILQKLIYPKITEMIDRKQERKRRVRGSKIMSQLVKTQSGEILTCKEHKKLFLVLAHETNFIFRADMAEALGLIAFKFETKSIRHEQPTDQEPPEEEEQPKALSREEFKEHYMDTFVDLLNDSDNSVQLKSIEAAAKLVGPPDGESFIDHDLFVQEFEPQLQRFMEQVPLDEDALQQFSAIFGEVIHSFYLKFGDQVQQKAASICQFFQRHMCQSSDAQTRENAAFNMPCMFKIFGLHESRAGVDFARCLRALASAKEEKPARIIIGSQFHEILRICMENRANMYEYVSAFVSIINCGDEHQLEIKLSALNNLATSVNLINQYFKEEVICDQWETEKLSLREVNHEPDIERYAFQIMEITDGIVRLLMALQEKPEKYWREIRTLFEQVVLMIDVQEADLMPNLPDGRLSKSTEPKEKASLGATGQRKLKNGSARQRSKSPPQLMQYFQLNHLCAKMVDVAFDLLLKGVHPLRQCSLTLICQFVLNIASSMKRQEYIARMRDSLFFERTRLSWKQILYIDFCNKVMPGVGVKFFKQQLLPDLMKHCQKLTFADPTSPASIRVGDDSLNERLDQKWRSPSPSLAQNLRPQSQVYFIRNSLALINEHCTYQDEELALCLMDVVDNFKNEDLECSDDEEDADLSAKNGPARIAKNKEKAWKREVSEAAFYVDDRMSYNIQRNMTSAKKKQCQRMEMIKLQKEKRLGMREQFELEHPDASLAAYDSDQKDGFDLPGRHSVDDAFNLDDLLRKSKFSKISGKYGHFATKKQQTTTFGTTKRFAPEPGSIHSKTQQKVLNSIRGATKEKDTSSGPSGAGMGGNGTGTASSSHLQICQSIDSERERDGHSGNKAPHPSSKTLLRNNRVRPLGRSQSKSKHRREAMRSDIFQPGSTQHRPPARPTLLSPHLAPANAQGPATVVEHGRRFHVPNWQAGDNYDILKSQTMRKVHADKAPGAFIQRYATKAPDSEKIEIILKERTKILDKKNEQKKQLRLPARAAGGGQTPNKTRKQSDSQAQKQFLSAAQPANAKGARLDRVADLSVGDGAMPASSFAEARCSVKTDFGGHAFHSNRFQVGTSSKKQIVVRGQLVLELPQGSGSAPGQAKVDPARRRHLFLSEVKPPSGAGTRGGGLSEDTGLLSIGSGQVPDALHSLSCAQAPPKNLSKHPTSLEVTAAQTELAPIDTGGSRHMLASQFSPSASQLIQHHSGTPQYILQTGHAMNGPSEYTRSGRESYPGGGRGSTFTATSRPGGQRALKAQRQHQASAGQFLHAPAAKPTTIGSFDHREHQGLAVGGNRPHPAQQAPSLNAQATKLKQRFKDEQGSHMNPSGQGNLLQQDPGGTAAATTTGPSHNETRRHSEQVTGCPPRPGRHKAPSMALHGVSISSAAVAMAERRGSGSSKYTRAGIVDSQAPFLHGKHGNLHVFVDSSRQFAPNALIHVLDSQGTAS